MGMGKSGMVGAALAVLGALGAAAAQAQPALALSEQDFLAEVPMDKRHNSKADYTRLKKMLA